MNIFAPIERIALPRMISELSAEHRSTLENLKPSEDIVLTQEKAEGLDDHSNPRFVESDKIRKARGITFKKYFYAHEEELMRSIPDNGYANYFEHVFKEEFMMFFEILRILDMYHDVLQKVNPVGLKVFDDKRAEWAKIDRWDERHNKQ